MLLGEERTSLYAPKLVIQTALLLEQVVVVNVMKRT
jgi:hypothetical protein